MSPPCSAKYAQYPWTVVCHGATTLAWPVSRTHGPKTPAGTGPPLFGGALGGLRIGRRDRLTTNPKRGTGQLPVSHHGRPVPADNGRPAGTGPEYVAPRPATCSSDAGHAAGRGSSAERASQARGGEQTMTTRRAHQPATGGLRGKPPNG